MSHPFLPILLIILVGAVLAGVILFLSSLVGPRRNTVAKSLPYDCGLNPIGNAREPVDVKFSMVAMLFILFDIEAVFIFPWALIYRESLKTDLGLFFLVEMGLFMVILALGLVYVWRKKAVDWK